MAILEGEVAISTRPARDRPPRSVGFPWRVEPALGPDGFVTAVSPSRCATSRSSATCCVAAVRGRAAQRSRAARVYRPARSAPAGPGIGLEIVGPHSSAATMRMLDFARSNRLPFTWRDPEGAMTPRRGARRGIRRGAAAAGPVAGRRRARGPSPGEVSRALGIGLELAAREEVDLLVVGAGPSGLGAAVYGASEGLDTLVIDSTGARRTGRLPAGSRTTLGSPPESPASELTSRAVTQARKFDARLATPYRALALEPGNGRHIVTLEDDLEVAARAVSAGDRCAIPAAAGRGPRASTRESASSMRPGRRRRSCAAPSASASSAAGTRPARPPSGWPAAGHS